MAPSAFFHRNVLRRSALRVSSSVLLAFASSSMLLSGCDSGTGKADKEIKAQLQETQAKVDASTAAPTDTNPDLKAASEETTDSLPVQIHAKVMFANNELQVAQGYAAKVLANDVLIDRLAREIGILGGQIQNNNQLVEALNKYDPSKNPAGQGKSVLDSIKDAQGEVTGSDEKPDWIKTDSAALASLNAVDKKLAGIQADAARLTDAIKTETDQRSQLLDTADKLSQQSQHEQGDKSVDLFTQGSNARLEAAKQTVKIDTDTAALARANDDLKVQQGQHDSLTAAIKALEDKSKSVSDSWKSVQDLIAKLHAASDAVLGVNPVDVPKLDAKGDLKTDSTIGSKASAIQQLADASANANANAALRAKALVHFDKAIDLYKTAANLAVQAAAEINKRSVAVDQGRPEQSAWSAQTKAIDTNMDLFMEADAELQKANFLARSAAEARLRLDMINALKPILSAAGLTPLSTLDETNPDLAKQLKESIGTVEAGAIGSYSKAAEILGRVSSSTAPIELRTSARAEEIFAQHSWASLATLAGDPQEAAKHMDLAKGLVSSSVTENMTLPPLPPDLPTK